MNHKKVIILYGFGEGQWHSKKIRRALADHGYTVVTSIKTADIILTHSAGAFFVPDKLRADQMLVLINPPYWPGRTARTRAHNLSKQVARAIRPGNQPFYHINKTIWNTLYFISDNRRNKIIMKRVQVFNLENLVTHVRTLVIRNNADAWLTPHLEKLIAINKNLELVHLVGEHDDCWARPNVYIEAIEHMKGFIHA